MTGLYDVEITLPGRTSMPFRITQVLPSRAWQIIDGFLAAWGNAAPRDLADITTFAAVLVRDGEYRHDDDGGSLHILVKPSS